MLVTDDRDLARRARALLEPSPQPAAKTRELFRSNLLRAGLTTNLGFAFGAYPACLLLSELAPERYEASFHEARAKYRADTGIYPIAEPQAAMARVGLRLLDRRNARRRRNAQYLRGCLTGIKEIKFQSVDPLGIHTFNAFPILIEKARHFARHLLRHGIDIRRDYMTWYAEPRFSEDVVYLPNHPGLRVRQMKHIGRVTREYYR